jgi:hypothetical protein
VPEDPPMRLHKITILAATDDETSVDAIAERLIDYVRDGFPTEAAFTTERLDRSVPTPAEAERHDATIELLETEYL